MARKKTFSSMEDVVFASGAQAGGSAAPAGDGSVILKKEDIVPSPYNEGLSMDNVDAYVESIRESGLLEPITVYSKDDGKYEILSGHQRFQAWCVVMGNDSIRAVVIPYEQDPIKRFKAHTQANTLQRNKDLGFWLSRIDMANRVLDESGFTGKKADRLQAVSSMLGGISTMQLYRYEGFRKLIPELQKLESSGCLSANTLYYAISLDEEQQKEVLSKVKDLQAVKASRSDDTEYAKEVTREEFVRIIDAVKKKGDTQEKAEPAKTTYMDKVSRSYESFLKLIGRYKTKEDREEAIGFIRRVRAELEALESELS